MYHPALPQPPCQAPIYFFAFFVTLWFSDLVPYVLILKTFHLKNGTEIEEARHSKGVVYGDGRWGYGISLNAKIILRPARIRAITFLDWGVEMRVVVGGETGEGQSYRVP